MKVIISNSPSLFIKKHRNSSLQRWIYLGSNTRIKKKLRLLFSRPCGEINFGEKLYEVSKETRKSFIQWLDEVSLNYKDDLRWMLSAPAVRNTYNSDLFLNVCYYKVLEAYLKEEKDIDFIFVDSPALARLIKTNYSSRVQYSRFNSFLSFFCYVKLFLKFILRFFRYLFDYGARFVCAKLIFKERRKKFFSDNKRIVLIRNFISDKFSDNDNDILEKHFFPGLYRHLEENKYTPVFLPIFIKPANYFKVFKRIFKSKRNIFVYEEFFKVRDYFYAFWAPFCSLAIKIKSSRFLDNNINGLLKEDFKRNLTSAEFLYSMLLSRFGIRLKEVHCSPEWMINWAENQTFEKGIIKGLKNVFKTLKVIGAQSFIVPPNYLSPVYSKQEELYQILPDRLLSLGPVWKDYSSQYIKDLKIEYSPAFRYASIAAQVPVKTQGDDLLVLLGINLSNSVSLLSILLKIYKSLDFVNDILIKLHPAANFDKNQLEVIIGERFPKIFNFVNGGLDQYFNNASVGLCGASGTSVELLMKGIPVVTIGETHTLTMNYLEYKEDLDMWQICFSSEQVLDALKHFNLLRKKNPDVFLRKANEFKGAFIMENNDKYWENCYI